MDTQKTVWCSSDTNYFLGKYTTEVVTGLYNVLFCHALTTEQIQSKVRLEREIEMSKGNLLSPFHISLLLQCLRFIFFT
jgi:hypothetical protein